MYIYIYIYPLILYYMLYMICYMGIYRVNFDCEIEVQGEKVKLNNVASGITAQDAYLTWCGYHINCRSLEVCIHYCVDTIYYKLILYMFYVFYVLDQ